MPIFNQMLNFSGCFDSVLPILKYLFGREIVIRLYGDLEEPEPISLPNYVSVLFPIFNPKI